MQRGWFITFEGGEGCGKSYQSQALYRRLTRRGIPARRLYEPGGSALGNHLGRLLKWAASTEISPLAELLLFNAARAQLVSQVIRPALERGEVVICDRYADSTTAYQSYGRGLGLDLVKDVNHHATGGLMPGLTVLLDLPPEEGMARTEDRRRDRFEKEDSGFHRRVRQGFLALARAEPERWLVIDGRNGKRKIGDIIWRRVNSMLSSSDR